MGQTGSSESGRRGPYEGRYCPYNPPPGNNPDLFLLEQEHKRERTGSFGSSRKKDRYVLHTHKQERFSLDPSRQRSNSETEPWLVGLNSERLRRVRGSTGNTSTRGNTSSSSTPAVTTRGGNNRLDSTRSSSIISGTSNKDVYELTSLRKSPRQGKRATSERITPLDSNSLRSETGSKKEGNTRSRSGSFSSKDGGNQRYSHPQVSKMKDGNSISKQSGSGNNNVVVVEELADNVNVEKHMEVKHNGVQQQLGGWLNKSSKIPVSRPPLPPHSVVSKPGNVNDENLISKHDMGKEKVAIRRLEWHKKKKKKKGQALDRNDNNQGVNEVPSGQYVDDVSCYSNVSDNRSSTNSDRGTNSRRSSVEGHREAAVVHGPCQPQHPRPVPAPPKAYRYGRPVPPAAPIIPNPWQRTIHRSSDDAVPTITHHLAPSHPVPPAPRFQQVLQREQDQQRVGMARNAENATTTVRVIQNGTIVTTTTPVKGKSGSTTPSISTESGSTRPGSSSAATPPTNTETNITSMIQTRTKGSAVNLRTERDVTNPPAPISVEGTATTISTTPEGTGRSSLVTTPTSSRSSSTTVTPPTSTISTPKGTATKIPTPIATRPADTVRPTGAPLQVAINGPLTAALADTVRPSGASPQVSSNGSLTGVLADRRAADSSRGSAGDIGVGPPLYLSPGQPHPVGVVPRCPPGRDGQVESEDLYACVPVDSRTHLLRDQNRNKTTKSSSIAATTSGTSTGAKRAGNQPDVVTQVAPPGAAAEIGRLEALCETRTKQLNIARMQLKTSAQGFDAMTVLVRYLTEELDAFSCPEVTAKLKTVKGQLVEAQQQIDLLAEDKATLEKSLGQLKTQHAAQVTQVKDAHREELQQLQKRLLAEKDVEVEKVVEKYALEVTTLKAFLDKNITDMKTKHEQTLAEHNVQQVKEVEQLKDDHKGRCQDEAQEGATTDLPVESQDLQKQHERRMEEITRTFENIKLTLSEKVETLRGECEEMRSREAHLEARSQREADMKIHLAMSQYKHLPAEIESLKAVMEMRNQELHELRHRKLELEKQLEEIPVAREKIISLQQKVENLEAVIQIKADYEKQLAEKHQLLLRKFDKEYKANKRLSMDNEELAWRLANSAESPDLLRRSISHSPTRASGEPTPEVVRRRKSPACSIPTSPRNQTEFDRSPVMLQSPPKTNLKRSGTYDLLNKDLDEKDMKQSDV